MRKKITKKLSYYFIVLAIITSAHKLEAQWTGLNPILTGSDVGIGHINLLGGMSSVITAPLGHLHISRIEPSSFTPGTILKPQLIIQSWCDGIGEPGSSVAISQSAFSLETNCYGNSLSLNDYNANQQLWSFSNSNTFSSVQNFNIANNFQLSSSDLTLNVPITGFTSTGTAHFNARANFSSHAYFYNRTYFHNDIQLKHNSSILFEDNTSTTQLGLFGNGYIRAREIKVDLQTIPDYVFKTGYKLMPLNELDAYIKANKHLPNIKGENDFNAAEGISLGEMNLKLLEKVEELTLYTIQQQKELDELKKLVNAFIKR